ncbi:alpha/beta hydrolase [Sporosarcina sp. PTS2304]|uniref:alpha/beta hydrolase n=1 Tax=Sporosarcina sp. PTS2304 TaxID=2283194 RepID=UPI0013B447AE|nr:alpha/beta hydrolase [Sporosarcina sp. PTS2304]
MCHKKSNVRKVEFEIDRVSIKGNFYTPEHELQKYPTIVMSHGFGAVKEMHIDRFAKAFSQNGFAVLLFDNRSFGESEGTPRQEINPWQQIEDYRHAITFVSTLKEVDADRIGVWGTSFSGGHSLVLGAIDHRVKCVVSQVPTISGFENAIRRSNGEKQKKLFKQFADDRKNRLLGEEPVTLQIIPTKEGESAVFPSQDAIEWYSEAFDIAPDFVNAVTLRSLENVRGYEISSYLELISPTPVLLLVAKEDFITPTDITLKAFEKILEPKKLILLDGGHFDVYTKEFEKAVQPAIEWFSDNL